jgi:hypothetical protein
MNDDQGEFFRVTEVPRSTSMSNDQGLPHHLVFDVDKGRHLRDEAIERVEVQAFSGAVAGVVRGLGGMHVTGEDIRRICTDRGVTPHHSNAWGGVISGLVRVGQLRATGEYRQMADTRSHARETKVYEVMGRVL